MTEINDECDRAEERVMESRIASGISYEQSRAEMLSAKEARFKRDLDIARTQRDREFGGGNYWSYLAAAIFCGTAFR